MSATPVFHGIPFPPAGVQARRPSGVRPRRVAAWALAAFACMARGQSDNFDDGNDTGWTRYAPLAPYGVPTVFSFPGGGYRIQTTAPTGDPNNPGRAGSFRTDVTYTDFYVSADLVNWNNDTRQAFGVLARIATPGLGQTTGYAFTYERGSGVTPTSGDLDIVRLDGEVPTAIETGPSGYHLDPAKDYRFVFTGRGAEFEGRLYELPDTTTPVVTIAAYDTQYPSGYGGLVIFDNSGGNGVTDATFDNYRAFPEEPPLLSIGAAAAPAGMTVTWPATFSGFRLYSTPTWPAADGGWTEETDIATDGLLWYHHEGMGVDTKFFRLAK